MGRAISNPAEAAAVVAIVAVIVSPHGRASWRMTRATGWAGLAVAGLSAVASYFYLAAFRNTTVADVAVIYATLPFWAAALGWLLLREREGWRVLAASLVALAGVALTTGGALGGRLVGDLLALAMTLTFALVMVLIRRARVSMLPAVALSCFLASVVAWPFARTGPWAQLPMLHLMLFGTAQLGLGLLLLTLGMRRVAATRAALIGLLDTPLAPLWVWLAFDEAPPALTLAGGGIVMAAVLWSLLGEATPAPPGSPGGSARSG